MESNIKKLIKEFLAAPAFAVVGASDDMRKFGAKVFACYRRHGLRAFPVHPTLHTVQGEKAYARLQDLPEPVLSVSIITPPAVTEQIVKDAAAAGCKRLWMQPGAESPLAIADAKALGMEVIAGGPCLLVELG